MRYQAREKRRMLGRWMGLSYNVMLWVVSKGSLAAAVGLCIGAAWEDRWFTSGGQKEFGARKSSTGEPVNVLTGCEIDNQAIESDNA